MSVCTILKYVPLYDWIRGTNHSKQGLPAFRGFPCVLGPPSTHAVHKSEEVGDHIVVVDLTLVYESIATNCVSGGPSETCVPLCPGISRRMSENKWSVSKGIHLA